MIVVIMAGGKGTRFWPLSVESRPKQFLTLVSDESMIQQTYRRFRSWLPKSAVYVVTTRMYAGILKEHLTELEDEQIIIEPEQRDTAPCIAMTALHFLRKGINDVLVFAPADQFIPDYLSLQDALELAAETATKGNKAVTLGIIPTRAEIGYGYIRAVPPLNAEAVLKVENFIEKPPLNEAEALLQEAYVYWNSGIIVWEPSTIALHMELYQPEMWKILLENESDIKQIYSSLPKLSVDYALLEKSETIYMIPVSFQWDDVGIWTSLERVRAMDDAGNVVQGEVFLVDSKNNIIHTDHQKTIVLGVNNLIIVSTEHGLLICHKTQEQQIKQIIQGWEANKGGKTV